MTVLLENRRKQNEKALALLDEWIADDTGYDDRVWPMLKKTIEANRLSERKLVDDNARDAGYGAARDDRSPAM